MRVFKTLVLRSYAYLVWFLVSCGPAKTARECSATTACIFKLVTIMPAFEIYEVLVRSLYGVAFVLSCLSIFSHLTMFVIPSSTSEIVLWQSRLPNCSISPAPSCEMFLTVLSLSLFHFSRQTLVINTNNSIAVSHPRYNSLNAVSLSGLIHFFGSLMSRLFLTRSFPMATRGFLVPKPHRHCPGRWIRCGGGKGVIASQIDSNARTHASFYF